MATTYLSKTFSSATSKKKWTWSAWVKRGKLGTGQPLFYADDGSANYTTFMRFRDTDQFDFSNQWAGSNDAVLLTNRKFRDPSAWIHLQVVWDSNNSTAADRQILYVNGVRETSFATETTSNQNRSSTINDGYEHRIGRGINSFTSDYFDGNMTHIHFADGQAYAPTVFGESDSTSGIWKPKASPTGITYGNNGFFLKFENSGAMGTDSSGNSFNWTVNGTLTQNVDTPSNNFPTLNSIHTGGGALAAHANGFGNGNLYNGDQSPNYWQSVPATIGLTSGKWYWELKDESDWGSTTDSTRRYGICDYDSIVSTLGSGADVRFSGDTSAYAYMNASGVRHNGSTISGTTSTHPTFQEGDFLMVAMDLDNNKLYFGKNGTWLNSGDPTSGASGTGSVADISATATWSPYIETKYGSDNVSLNFGQGYFRTTSAGTNTDSAGLGKFKYTVPSGYYSICTNNIKNYG